MPLTEQQAHQIARNEIQLGALPVGLPSYAVADVPTASDYPNALIYVSDETGGAVPAFSDGSTWRRCTDRTEISA